MDNLLHRDLAKIQSSLRLSRSHCDNGQIIAGDRFVTVSHEMRLESVVPEISQAPLLEQPPCFASKLGRSTEPKHLQNSLMFVFEILQGFGTAHVNEHTKVLKIVVLHRAPLSNVRLAEAQGFEIRNVAVLLPFSLLVATRRKTASPDVGVERRPTQRLNAPVGGTAAQVFRDGYHATVRGGAQRDDRPGGEVSNICHHAGVRCISASDFVRVIEAVPSAVRGLLSRAAIERHRRHPPVKRLVDCAGEQGLASPDVHHQRCRGFGVHRRLAPLDARHEATGNVHERLDLQPVGGIFLVRVGTRGQYIVQYTRRPRKKR